MRTLGTVGWATRPLGLRVSTGIGVKSGTGCKTGTVLAAEIITYRDAAMSSQSLPRDGAAGF